MSDSVTQQPMPDAAPETTTASRGRPRVLSLAERSRRILAAGELVLVRDGYGGTTMEEVARVAGMSKKTVYRLYPDKQHLFAAVVSDVEAFPSLKAPEPEASKGPREVLRDHLLAMAEFVLSPRQVGMTRLLISEAGHTPELADAFYARVMSKGRVYLIESLTRMLEAEGLAANDDVEAASMVLFSGALGGLHLAALLGKQTTFSRRQLLAQIDLALEMAVPHLLVENRSAGKHPQPERKASRRVAKATKTKGRKS